jgi:P-type Cu+ transporter
MKVHDKVCGMSIEAENAAATVDYKDTTYYFCSEGCRTTFEEHPDRFVPDTGSEEGSEEHGHCH